MSKKRQINCACDSGREGCGFIHCTSDGAGAEFIARCDECARFKDDDAAQEAHDAACGCDWGVSTLDKVLALIGTSFPNADMDLMGVTIRLPWGDHHFAICEDWNAPKDGRVALYLNEGEDPGDENAKCVREQANLTPAACAKLLDKWTSQWWCLGCETWHRVVEEDGDGGRLECYCQKCPKTCSDPKGGHLRAVAEGFVKVLRSWLKPSEWREMVRRNKAYRAEGLSCCASHEFCDSNMAMAEAMEAEGIVPNAEAMLWNDAWSLAAPVLAGGARDRKCGNCGAAADPWAACDNCKLPDPRPARARATVRKQERARKQSTRP